MLSNKDDNFIISGNITLTGLPRDHNTKRAKLIIDVGAMFVVAKAIFSNFAIARARLSKKRNLKAESKPSRPRARQRSNSIV